MVETGRLIVLEGVDDAVLGALAEGLCDGLRERGTAAEHTREPTYGPAGAQVQLARWERLQIDPVSLALLCLADRLDHLDREDGIRAWLFSGRHVLCVHYALYAYAWQWGQVDWDWQRRIDASCPVPNPAAIDLADTGLQLAAPRADAVGDLETVLAGSGRGVVPCEATFFLPPTVARPAERAVVLDLFHVRVHEQVAFAKSNATDQA